MSHICDIFVIDLWVVILYQWPLSINQSISVRLLLHLPKSFVPPNSESFDLRICFTIFFSALPEMYLIFVFIYISTYLLSYMYLFNIPFRDFDQDMYLSWHLEICICHFVIWNRDTWESQIHVLVRSNNQMCQQNSCHTKHPNNFKKQ